MKLLDNDALALTPAEFDALLEYSTTLPTGTTPGKAWKARKPFWAPAHRAEWWRGTYGLPYPEGHQHHGSVPIGWRRIVRLGQPAAFPWGVTVPPPPMRGRITAYVPPAPEPPQLPEGLWERDGVLMCECRVCERAMPAECDPADFAPDMAYCGGSPRCCP